MTSRHTPGTSKRWSYFHDALQTANQNVARKWKYQDFAECFPQYAEDDPDGALQTFNQIAAYVENTNLRDMDLIFKEYNAQENIDILDDMIKTAKARKASGNIGPDVSTAKITAASLAGGRTFPILRQQAERLRESLDKIRAENSVLVADLEKTVNQGNKIQEQVVSIVNKIETAYEAWENMPMEDVEQWTAQISATTRQEFRS